MDQSQVAHRETSLPLCCDLDGTLIRSDLLWETLILLLKTEPLYLLLVPFWLLGGRSVLKMKIAQHVQLDPESIPYNSVVLQHLRDEQAKGRQLFLVSASADPFVQAVANHIGVFAGSFGTTHDRNLKGSAKASLLESRFGRSGFEYIGDSFADLPVWSRAAQGIAVNPSPSLWRRLVRVQPNATSLNESRPPLLHSLIRCIRPYQAIKNILVFLPLIASHQVFNESSVIKSALAFIAFTLAAWSGYVLNDLIDLSHDRRHPKKHKRPLAHGVLPIPIALLLLFTFVLAAIAIAIELTPGFFAVLATYYFLSVAYSLWLKSQAGLDVIVLTTLYVARIVAGHEATGIAYSPWLLTFSMFLFLSLAYIKRYSELMARRELNDDSALSGRGYVGLDLPLVMAFGISSGYISVLVMALYIYSQDVRRFYDRPVLLWMLCPLLLYWLSRTWLVAGRGEMHHDPVVFALTDKLSLICGVIGLVVVVLASVL